MLSEMPFTPTLRNKPNGFDRLPGDFWLWGVSFAYSQLPDEFVTRMVGINYLWGSCVVDL